MGNKKLGAIELKPRRKFYDYEAKYNSNAKTKHIIPVNLPKNKLRKFIAQNYGFKIIDIQYAGPRWKKTFYNLKDTSKADLRVIMQKI